MSYQKNDGGKLMAKLIRGVGNQLRLDELLLLIAIENGVNTTPKTVRRFLESFEKVILSQLKLNDEISIYNLGRFYLRTSGGEVRNMGDPLNGGTVRRYMKPKLQLGFDPAPIILRAINDNDFQYEDKKTKRRYSRPEYREIRNERRRQEPPTAEELFCELGNKANSKRKEQKVNKHG